MSVPSRFIFPSLEDQHFAMCITPQDFILPFLNIQRRNYYRPWKWCTQKVTIKDIGSTIIDDKGSFRIILDVDHFHVNEIDVKVTENNIIITGAHEERQDEHGLIARKFTRRYILPRDCSSENVTCTFSTDGILTVHIVKKPIQDINDKEKIIPIKINSSYIKTEIKNQMNSGIAPDIEQSSIVKEIKENSNKEKQVMVWEDDYCFLKPNLLGNVYSAFREVSDAIENSHSEFDAEVDELMNAHSHVLEQAKNVVSEFLEEPLGSPNVTTALSSSDNLELNYNNLQQSQHDIFATPEMFNAATLPKISNKGTAATSVSELINTHMAVAASSEVMASELNESSASNITEESFFGTTKEFSMERSENCEQFISTKHFEEPLKQSGTAVCTLTLSECTEQSNTSTMEQSEQISTSKMEQSEQKKSLTMEQSEQFSSSTIEQSEHISSMIEKSEQMSTSKMEESEQITSTKMEPLEQLNISAISSEVSTSNATTMQGSLYEASASVKATTEELNDFITDVIAELREATENL